ncbi:MAG TPA: DedA family protein, partial [Candidatus Thermoplasmatota archaeon]|nr:DedA family protein [Candidatus Thermoplasmatota archaeon]
MAVDAAALLESLLRYAYPIIFLAGLAEAVPLLGILIPGQAVIIAAGALAATGRLDLKLVLLAALPAGILGDAIGYYAGRRYGRPFLEKYGHRLRISDEGLRRGDRLFAKYGPFALVLARFSFLTRGITALLAGITRLPQRVFWPVNVIGGVAWAFGFVLTGYLGASAFLYLQGRLGVILAVTLLVAVGIYLLYRILRRNAPQFTREDLALALVAVAGGTVFGVLADRVVAEGPSNRIDAWQDAYVAALAPLAPLLDAIAWATSLTAMGAAALALLAFLAYRR